MFTRYVGDPVATARVLEDGWLRTGDRARQLPSGEIVLTGRVQAVVAARDGAPVDTAEITARLRGVFGDCTAVFAAGAPDGGVHLYLAFARPARRGAALRRCAAGRWRRPLVQRRRRRRRRRSARRGARLGALRRGLRAGHGRGGADRQAARLAHPRATRGRPARPRRTAAGRRLRSEPLPAKVGRGRRRAQEPPSASSEPARALGSASARGLRTPAFEAMSPPSDMRLNQVNPATQPNAARADNGTCAESSESEVGRCGCRSRWPGLGAGLARARGESRGGDLRCLTPRGPRSTLGVPCKSRSGQRPGCRHFDQRGCSARSGAPSRGRRSIAFG